MNDEQKALLKDWKEKKKNKFKAKLPVSKSKLEKLFDFVATKLDENSCDDTLRFTLEFIQEKKMPETKAIHWLKENGGFCDCEVLANVKDEFITNLGERLK